MIIYNEMMIMILSTRVKISDDYRFVGSKNKYGCSSLFVHQTMNSLFQHA